MNLSLFPEWKLREETPLILLVFQVLILFFPLFLFVWTFSSVQDGILVCWKNPRLLLPGPQQSCVALGQLWPLSKWQWPLLRYIFFHCLSLHLCSGDVQCCDTAKSCSHRPRGFWGVGQPFADLVLTNYLTFVPISGTRCWIQFLSKTESYADRFNMDT